MVGAATRNVSLMTLDEDQKEGTRRELRRNLELAGSTLDALAVELAWSRSRLENTLTISPEADPVDVWILRDALEVAVRSRGEVPERYTVLTEGVRAQAERWFGLSRRR